MRSFLKKDWKEITVLGIDWEEGETLLVTLSVYSNLWHRQLCVSLSLLFSLWNLHDNGCNVVVIRSNLRAYTRRHQSNGMPYDGLPLKERSRLAKFHVLCSQRNFLKKLKTKISSTVEPNSNFNLRVWHLAGPKRSHLLWLYDRCSLVSWSWVISVHQSTQSGF